MLAKTIDPIKLAKQHASLTGEVALSACPRLQEFADQENNQAHVQLEFGIDAGKHYFIRGKLQTVITVVCQRCNALFTLPLDVAFLLGPITTDLAAEKLPAQYEPIFIENESISVAQMIEDEILLAMPMVPKHEAGKC